jgi:hypothetical protein
MGWLGGWGVLRVHIGMELRGWPVAVPRLVSWGCGLALAVGGLWRVAVAVTR